MSIPYRRVIHKPSFLEKTFHIYRSSAGSGKTRTLAREYILLALRHPDDFKYILAVTFANKASQEMKDRVIRYLGDFREGRSEDLSLEIQAELKWDAATVKQKSGEVLTRILHQYAQFSISTIDAFFQKIIRAFTRESGLLGNFRLEAENDLVLHEVISGLMDELGETKKDLTDWVIRFSRERLIGGDAWNITHDLEGFAKEILKDTFKVIEDDIQRVREKISFPQFLEVIRNEKKTFMEAMKIPAVTAMKLLEANQITSDDFSYKEVGTAYKYFKEFMGGRYVEPKPRILTSAENASVWPDKKSRRYPQLRQLAEQRLVPLLNEMLNYDRKNFIRYISCQLVEDKFYSYGLISDITRKLRDYKSENNLMLLSDASHFLNGVINNSDTPFIYEKVGSFYRHYLIDEFQDTSALQWKNFLPLLRDALDQNNKSLVVGDVKQSIYRWRGGDLDLLQNDAESQVGTERTETIVLDENWRSAENLVLFNNVLFPKAAQRVGEATGHPLPADTFKDLVQKPVRHKGLGYIHIQFLENWSAKDDDNGEEQALQQVPHMLEQLQAAGVPLNDTAILVRKNEEGQRIADFLLKYKSSAQAKADVLYDVVSNESLRLDAAASVLLLISALKYLNNPKDKIARGELVYEHLNRSAPGSPEQMESRFAQAGANKIQSLLPEEFVKREQGLVKLSLFELTETLIRIFRLGDDVMELAYLQSFQDQVLEFASLEKNDIASFLEWWEEIKEKRSIQVAANSNAVSIYTIHKAKGMQFRYVIIPFCSWRMSPELPPLLWCKSEEKPFDRLGYVAVDYSKKLEGSFFADEYKKEFTKSYLDNLNILYVALTRAEEGMLVIAPKPIPGKEEDKKISTVGQLLYESIVQSEGLSKDFHAGSNLFLKGTIKSLSGVEENRNYVPIRLQRYPATDWRRKLVIKREGKEFFLEAKTDQRKKINYGILMHRVLSQVHYADQIEAALRKLNLEGVIMEEEATLLKKRMEAMMEHPAIGGWFKKDWRVLTEVPVIIPGGSQDRLDRVIFKDVTKKGVSKHKAVVIDYKTGSKRTEDRKQVEAYSQALLDMDYVDVEGYLIYLDKLEVVPVVNKMNLSLDL